MSDRYLEFANSPLGKSLASSLGLPAAPRLRRAKQHMPRGLWRIAPCCSRRR